MLTSASSSAETTPSLSSYARGKQIASLMEPVAARLLGKPNEQRSKYPNDVRFGTRGSLSIDFTTGCFFDYEHNRGGGVIDFVRAQLECDHTDAVVWLRREGLLAEPPQRTVKSSITAEYNYLDENNVLLFKVVRFTPKDFRPRRPDGQITLEGVRRVLYRLPELLKAAADGRVIYICEGEKDADNVCRLGLVATTNVGGANKWRDEYNKSLRGADVVLLPHNDDAGRKHADQVAASLNGVAKRIRVLDLAEHWPGCPLKGDVSNWIDAGGTADKLKVLVEALSEIIPLAGKEPPRPLMRDLPPPGPFPIEALGGILANAAIGIQDRTRAPIAICGQSVMAAATLVTQGHADVRLPTGQLRPLSNFFATVAVTGERKTAADTEAIWPIRKREEALRDRYGPARQEYENAKQAWEAARSHATKAGKGNAAAIKAALAQLGPPPNEPLLPFLAVTEPTIEGLVKVFAKGLAKPWAFFR
jgi:hypothetical protein